MKQTSVTIKLNILEAVNVYVVFICDDMWSFELKPIYAGFSLFVSSRALVIYI
jgi:hypothetical protein